MNRVYTIIMNIIPVDERGYIFTYDHTSVGVLDEKDVFIDKNGNKYVSMLSGEFLKNNAKQVYFNLFEEDKLKEDYNNLSEEEIIEKIDSSSKNIFYFLGLSKEGKIYLLLIDRDKVAKEQDKLNHLINRNNDLYAKDYTINMELEQLLGELLDEKYSIKDYEGIMKNIDETNQLTKKIEEAIISKTKNNYVDVKPKKKSTKNKNSNRINIDNLYNSVTKTLIAQDEPARRVITELARKEMDSRKKREGILLVGPTGVGKTELMKLIAKYIDRPFIKVDSTQLTIPGYVGKDIEEVLWDLYEKCGRNIKKTEEAIIFFDEIDKKGSSKKSDVSGKGVLNVLLSFIEGSTYDACQNVKTALNTVKINTSNMTVIFGGAFSEIYKKEEKNELGFVKKSEEEKDKSLSATKNFTLLAEMPEEFMSRVTVVRLNELDVESIKRILLESDESAIKIQQEIFDKLGVKLTFTNNYIDRVAKDAYEKKTGARGLNGIIDESTWKAFDEVYSHPSQYKEIILDEDTLTKPESYQYVKRNKRR